MRFSNTPPQAGLPRADDHAAGHADGAMAPEFPAGPEDIPTVPIEKFANLPDQMSEEAMEHLPGFFDAI